MHHLSIFTSHCTIHYMHRCTKLSARKSIICYWTTYFRSPKREFNLRSHFTFILFWRNLTLVNMLDTSELHFSGKPTTGSWSNFRLQKWKMAENKYDYKIHSILFTVLYCFLFFCIYNCSFLRYRVEQQHFEKCTIFWRHKYKII